jgi:hypothetical protein
MIIVSKIIYCPQVDFHTWRLLRFAFKSHFTIGGHTPLHLSRECLLLHDNLPAIAVRARSFGDISSPTAFLACFLHLDDKARCHLLLHQTYTLAVAGAALCSLQSSRVKRELKDIHEVKEEAPATRVQGHPVPPASCTYCSILCSCASAFRADNIAANPCCTAATIVQIL